MNKKTHTQKEREKWSDDHLSRLCVILPFYAHSLGCPLQRAPHYVEKTRVSIPKLISLRTLLNFDDICLYGFDALGSQTHEHIENRLQLQATTGSSCQMETMNIEKPEMHNLIIKSPFKKKKHS